jgi:glycosyltransferase involved in cell wall biosynthesis
VVISSGQPSANPRLVKEAVTLDQFGYKVTVIYVPISPWAAGFDDDLFQKYSGINFIQAGYHPYRQQWLYKWARVRRKLLNGFCRRFGDVLNLSDYTTILFGQELLRIALQHKADLYIAHNLGALPVAVKAARLHNAKVGFDAEDFHRGEFAAESEEKMQTKNIENKYLPQIDYLTAASPLIGDAYKSLFPKLSPVIINNVFPLCRLKHVHVQEDTPELRLFWFSQSVGRNRGIECVLQAIGLIKDLNISLTLLGNLNSSMKVYFSKVATDAYLLPEQIHFMGPVPQDELFKIAAEFDVGVGSEIPYCFNRDICLTNKIFTYLLAGNALVLSDTKAQSRFLEEHPGIGMLYKHDHPESLAAVLRFYAVNRVTLSNHQKSARELAEKKLNWEVESKKLINLLEAVLQK